jgi:hypothetical protein
VAWPAENAKAAVFEQVRTDSHGSILPHGNIFLLDDGNSWRKREDRHLVSL